MLTKYWLDLKSLIVYLYLSKIFIWSVKMPFIVYFFLSFMTIYIPFPTFLMYFHNFSETTDIIVAINKPLLLFLLIPDYFISFYILRKCRIRKTYYFYLLGLNLIEWTIQLFLFMKYESVQLTIVFIFQTLFFFCLIVFPFSKKFRNYIFS